MFGVKNGFVITCHQHTIDQKNFITQGYFTVLQQFCNFAGDSCFDILANEEQAAELIPAVQESHLEVDFIHILEEGLDGIFTLAIVEKQEFYVCCSHIS